MLDVARHSPLALAAFLSLIACALAPAHAQSISTNTQVPPLQWINLTPHTSGPAPPPLKDASIGYDEAHRNLVIFGGESQSGDPVSQTYLLNLDTLTWAVPASPNGLSGAPPPRSAAISGQDIAASYRNGLVVIGGRGQSGKVLSDVWEFDYTNQFWSQVSASGGPSPRWGAAGGIDLRTQPGNNGLENTLYLTGGFTDNGAESLSEVWQLTLSGTLSSNLPNEVKGTWNSVKLQNQSLPHLGGSATAVVFLTSQAQQHIVAVGGCSSSSNGNAACANGVSYVIDVDARSNTAPNGCPAPRLGAALAANLNAGSTSFNGQVFQLLGTFNSSEWQDDDGLSKGEVDVLDLTSNTWARIIPAGDPTSQPQVPTPREGPAVFSWRSALVGSPLPPAADTVVFGGRDASGKYLSELWVLRAYNGSITGSDQQWSGYGSGQLAGGPNADGTGVKIQYLSRCASQIAQPTPTGTSSSSSPTSSSNSPSPTSGPDGHYSTSYPYDTSVIHKSLAAVSAALVFPATVFYRLSQPSIAAPGHNNARIGFFYLASVVGLVAFALGVGGLATAFTSLRYTASLAKRSLPSHLATAHGRAGIALFVGLYGLVPALIALSLCLRWNSGDSPLPARRRRANSNDIHEKMELYHGGRTGSPYTNGGVESPTPEPINTLSPYSSVPIPTTRASSESAMDDRSSPSKGSFEVVNRPTRARRASAHSLAAFSDPRPSISPRNLSDMSWLQRRRSLGTVDDLDYAHMQQRRQVAPSTPGTTAADMMSTNELMDGLPQHGQPTMPGALDCVIHILLHLFLLAVSVLALVALFQRASIAAFAVFIAWTVIFYAVIFTLAWRGVPSESILTVFLSRIRSPPPPPPTVAGMPGVPFPNGAGPYQHQPPYRPAHDSEYPTSISHAGHTMEGDDDDDDDVDDDTRQRRIEEEMARREVSIVTVPKRRLQVVNS